MFEQKDSSDWKLEVAVVVLAIGITTLLATTTGMKIVVLNLFFLPVVLAGFFLGRYRAGILAFFSVLSASIVVFLDLPGYAALNDLTVMGLSLITWGAVLCLTALMVGTLSDVRAAKTQDLHEAYIGVVEVLSRYLQSANPVLEAKSNRVANLSQLLARHLRLSSQDVDDIGVAALLHDVGNIEITAKVIQKAMGNITSGQEHTIERTFQGADLVRSLGSVLRGALPLLVDQHSGIHDEPGPCRTSRDAPIGASVICAVRAYDFLTNPNWGEVGLSSQDALEQLRAEFDRHPPYIIDALESAIATSAHSQEKMDMLAACST